MTGKTILITGASSGIGKAMVEYALSAGAKVSACGRSIQRLRKAFPNSGSNLQLIEADVASEEDCKNFVSAAVLEFGKVDILINNAGVSMRALFEETELSVLREMMDTNFWGSVYCTKFALPFIKKQKGVIVGISSIAGNRGLPARSGYSASKFALQGFLESIRTELLHTGTSVIWVAPGFTASNIRNVALAADGKMQGETPLKEDSLMSAEECARRIFQAISNRKRTTVMTSQGKLTVWLNKLFPSVLDRLIFRHFLKEPDSPLKRVNRPANESR